MYKIVLCGTPDFVVKFFDEFLNNNNFDIAAVITRCPKANKNASLLAIWAKKNNLKLFEVQKINQNEELKNFFKNIDLVLVFAFGQIIKQDLLNLPKFGWLNIHPSKLPLLRGPSPIQYAILNEFSHTALTLMKMNNNMDEGNIIAQKEFKINCNHNFKTIFYEMSIWGPSWILENVLNYLTNSKSIQQNSNESTYCYLIQKKDYHITNDDSVITILNKIKAYGHVFLTYNKIVIKCFVAKVYKEGDFLNINGICPILIQLPGKKIMHIRNYLNGNK